MRCMSTKDLAAKYGKSRNATQNINAAIRAEIPGGSQALDALDALRHRFESKPSADTEAGYNWAQAIVSAMAAEIRRRYDLPPRQE